MPHPQPLVLDGAVPYPTEFATRYREQGIWTDQTHSELLFSVASRHPGKAAVIAGDTRITYAELSRRALQFAAGLQAEGIGRGDRVVLHLPNLPDYIPLLFAVFEIGALPVLAPAALGSHEIDHVTSSTGAQAYVTAAAAGAATPHVPHSIVLERDAARLLSHGTLVHERRSLPSDVAFLQLSGGTTGLPKVVAHTHESYLASVRSSVRVCGITDDSVQLIVLPMSHSFAMRSPGFLGVLSAGGTVVLAPNGSPDVAFPLIREHRVTDVSLVPPLALAWLNSSLRSEHDLSSLQVIRVGGAKFSSEAARRVRHELGATVQQSFEMAEGLATFTALDAAEETIVTRQGRPAPSDEIRIVDDHDDPVAPGTPGHLLTRGPSTIRGYFRAPEHNARSFTPDGFYRTGDIVCQDEQGYLTVVGRSKDQINRGGEKIAPEEVENLLLAHDSIHDVSIVGIPDEILGERAKAYVVARDGADAATLTLAGIRGFLRGRGLAGYKLPDVVELVDEFQTTAVGKISKRMQRSQ